ncbi:VOC family protein [Actinomadura vinacea]|uniref:2-oxoadipate dioxygenase/decarboxylase n=1 Tax=Actinomadura vinacea TaxID=115336 RepID=A0ABN3IBS6_9ACTN
MTRTVPAWELRSRFANSLSALYGTEVPAYATLVEVAQEVNSAVLRERGAQAERLGSIDRVTAERHGAIRIGTPHELRQIARIFGAVGMYPTGFYDLREAAPTPIPVVSTAFRPIDPGELARNPFRVFTSMLVPGDRRFFDDDVRTGLEGALARRRLFSDELLELADAAEAEGGLPEPAAGRFVELATQSFALSGAPIDRAWYRTLEKISSVAADIGGVSTTHINHLTPRVLDIDELYRRMQARGIVMIDRIQGPPRWHGPDVLLRQTSFRALAEPRRFTEPDGTIGDGELRVRFGEVEARGVALTPAGRDRYDRLMSETDGSAAAWAARMPPTERAMAEEDLAYFTATLNRARPRDGHAPPTDLPGLARGGWVNLEPIVYEDFLPRSAAGIFSSNLTGQSSVDHEQDGAVRDAEWLAGVLDRPLHDPFVLYDRQRADSLRAVATELGTIP